MLGSRRSGLRPGRSARSETGQWHARTAPGAVDCASASIAMLCHSTALGVRRSCRPPTVTPPAAQPSTRAARCARRAMRGFLFASPLNLMFSVEMKQPPLYGAPKLRDPLGRPGGVGLHDGLLISAEPAFRSSVCTKLNRCGTVAVFSFFLHGVRTEPDAGDLRRR